MSPYLQPAVSILDKQYDEYDKFAENIVAKLYKIKAKQSI